ncbi:DUF4233 domain-containing protein [Agromyces sp. S2-1-8]|uniref:DUF4233 domain-containing protein n=1 Tax=Agromyces sp. S2-1-8 TaxID=2897180 RepID=UPI001E363371|nr:DUF4233 domain-containing protein [Agromyces sp. S2-1-8]MCD5347108.1 DUF4233 domain-containing protein [Agromyces sp. S2-1-8]
MSGDDVQGFDEVEGSEPDASAAPARPPRSIRQSLGAIVLGFETIVVFLAALVVWGLAQGDAALGVESALPPWVALVAGGVIILGLIATIGLLRFDWAYTLGWVLQVLIVASGFINPAMFVVGALFGGMWWYCMVAGSRIDRQRAEFTAPGKEQQ